MSYEVYKLIHVIGILMLFVALGGLTHYVIGGGNKQDNPWRAQAAMTHGIGLFLILLGGFGMLARLKIGWPWPSWIYGKVLIWMVLGALVAVIYRKPALAKSLWFGVLVFGIIAASLGIMHPR